MKRTTKALAMATVAILVGTGVVYAASWNNGNPNLLNGNAEIRGELTIRKSGQSTGGLTLKNNPLGDVDDEWIQFFTGNAAFLFESLGTEADMIHFTNNNTSGSAGSANDTDDIITIQSDNVNTVAHHGDVHLQSTDGGSSITVEDTGDVIITLGS